MASHGSVQADEEVGKSAMFHGQQRRKGIGTRVWLVLAEAGESRVEEFNKQSIMRRTGLPGRDLRILDPMLSYPSTILGRERAIVINLEHIKAIITAKEFLMLNSTNPLILQFVNLLKSRICSFPVTPQNAKDGTEKENAVDATWSSSPAKSHQDTPPNAEKASRNSTMGASGAAEPKVLPFEFRALEACLESACRCLESETQTLEQEAYPALDELTSQISTLNLERVRQIKSRLVAISGRVQKVRDELEHLLDDDHDMAEMHLAEKLGDGLTGQPLFREESNNEAAEADDERPEESKSEQNSEISTGFKPNIEELEMLLEAYFAQIDGISQKLFNMTEYVDNTEDFINIMLDDKQNHMLRMGVTLSTANMILNAGIVVVGVFGMNIHIALFDSKPLQFWQTTFGTIGGCVVLYLIVVGWGRKRNLL